MVIYLDTSALIKLYIAEDGRDVVLEATAITDTVATSTAAYAEARAGLARRFREGDFTDQEHRDAVSVLDADWATYTRLPVTNVVAAHAGHLAERYALRGYDAIYLASAIDLSRRFEHLRFLAFDHRLLRAVREAGVSVFS